MYPFDINPDEMDRDELLSALGRIEVLRYKMAGTEKEIHDRLDELESPDSFV